MTEHTRQIPPTERRAAVRETPQRRPSTFQRWLPKVALTTSVLVVLGVAAVLFVAGSDHHVVKPPPTPPIKNGPTSVIKHRPTSVIKTRPTHTHPPSARPKPAAPTRPKPAAPTGPLAALSSYWQAIGRHEFTTAYAILAPGAIPQTETQWVSDEQGAGIQAAEFEGQIARATTTAATVQVLSLVTRDAVYGCRSWTGTYAMINLGGPWLIERADLTPRVCPPA